MVSLELVKQWLKIEWDEEDGILAFLLKASQTHLKTSGCVIPEESSDDYPTYELATLMLVSHWYNNRTGADDMNDILSKPLTFGIQDLILKLKAIPKPGADDSNA